MPTPTFPFAANLFENQVVVITGGGTGIGLASAQRFAALGAKVAIGSRKQQNIDAGLAVLREEAPEDRLYGSPLDTRDATTVDAWVEGVLAKFGRGSVAGCVVRRARASSPSAGPA